MAEAQGVARGPERSPWLLVATVVTTLEGLALTGFGAWLGYESLVATASNDDVAHGSTAYFLVLGLLVLVVAWALWRRQSWSLGAAVFLQLVALPVAVTMWQAGFLTGALPLALAAVTALLGLLRPESREALGRR